MMENEIEKINQNRKFQQEQWKGNVEDTSQRTYNLIERNTRLEMECLGLEKRLAEVKAIAEKRVCCKFMIHFENP